MCNKVHSYHMFHNLHFSKTRNESSTTSSSNYVPKTIDLKFNHSAKKFKREIPIYYFFSKYFRLQ